MSDWGKATYDELQEKKRINRCTKMPFLLYIWKNLEDELDVEVEVAIPKKNQWDDEDAEDQVKESWEDSDDEKESKEKKPAPVLKKKVPLKQKIAEKQAAEEKKRQELEAKKLAGEDDKEEEEDAFARKERLRQLELEADMASATDLFSGVSVSMYGWGFCQRLEG